MMSGREAIMSVIDDSSDSIRRPRTTHLSGLAWLISVAVLAGCAGTTALKAPAAPDALRPPPNQVLTLETLATGVQIYECQASQDQPPRFEWVFTAPEAELFDRAGRLLGKHYAGPTWLSTDGSTVVGEVKARDAGTDPDAIPWLLLTAKSRSGNGVFGQVGSIQRLETSGGKAPAEPCNQEAVSRVARVPYKATYYFYVPRP